ncbi:MAG: isoprenylcysteine carboxylmethyltransferase family protein [Verrucomicrobia bacterium]|nr:isoprenylcysteine carboxylmethyltransferase family protein [Verrucomicrobiota bacterium]
MLNHLKVIAFMAMMIGILFGSAGRVDLPFVWATVAIYVIFMGTMLLRMDPDLLRERMQPGPGGKGRTQRKLMIPVVMGQWVVAGLDVGRYHWSDTVPASVQVAALAAFALGLSLSGWAMSVNRFFSSVVRIQPERGHHVVTGGPYQFIRHPGYLGAVISSVGGTLAIGSWWAMGVTLVFLLLFLRRVLMEDKFLHEQLAGYGEYAARVRYRLFPGIW